jgi:transmembrane sensor
LHPFEQEAAIRNVDELISRSLKGRTTPAEEQSLRAWRQSSDENEAYYRQLVLVLEEAGESLMAGATPPIPPLGTLVGVAAAREARPHGKSERTRWVWGGLAAAMVATALAIVLLYPVAGDPPPALSLQAGEFVTGATETATAVLSDGTVVRLAPKSRLRIPGGAGTRDVILEGQAFFAVAELPGHPFRVRTPAGEARVLGTRFEVRVHNEELRLIVVEGRVALDAGGRQVEVGAGEMSLVKDGEATAAVAVQDLEPLMGWLKRFVVFQSKPLYAAARELEREYGVRVIVTDATLAQETITGWYADRTFEEVLMIICGVMQARCSIGNGTATISPH